MPTWVQSAAWGAALLAMQDYLRMEAGDNWREIFVSVLSGLIVERGEQLNVEFGMEFDVRNLLAEGWTLRDAPRVIKESSRPPRLGPSEIKEV